MIISKAGTVEHKGIKLGDEVIVGRRKTVVVGIDKDENTESNFAVILEEDYYIDNSFFKSMYILEGFQEVYFDWVSLSDITPITKTPKQLLEPGMVVQLRNKEYYLVTRVKGELMGINNRGYIDALLKADYLLGMRDSQFDIIKIYKPVSYSHTQFRNLDTAELVWERVEKSPHQLEYEAMEEQMKQLQQQMADFKARHL